MQVLTRAAVRSHSRVRLVGKTINEVVPTEEAFVRAEENGMDLVLVNDECDPPVVRIQDFKKIQYEKKKSRKPTKKISLKEVQFKANISDHDFQTKMKSIEKFLERGDKVKVVVRLKGRERDTPERAEAILVKVAASINCKISRVPGPIVTAILEQHSTK